MSKLIAKYVCQECNSEFEVDHGDCPVCNIENKFKDVINKIDNIDELNKVYNEINNLEDNSIKSDLLVLINIKRNIFNTLDNLEKEENMKNIP